MTERRGLRRAWRRFVAALFQNFPYQWGVRDAMDEIDWSKCPVQQRVYGAARRPDIRSTTGEVTDELA